MRRYHVETLIDNAQKYFYIRDCETMDIVLLPSKYLKHKVKYKSPNTVRRSAFSICYYLEYLKEIPMEITDVYGLDFEKQNEHFTGFLYWLKAGNHRASNNLTPITTEPVTHTWKMCSGSFFIYRGTDEQFDSLKVLSYNYHITPNAVGVKKTMRYQAFKGYLKAEERKVRPAEHEEITEILKACTNCRDQLLILLIAETGFRIGEISVLITFTILIMNTTW